jgi:hypothetical protein
VSWPHVAVSTLINVSDAGRTQLPFGVGYLDAHTSSVATCAAPTVSKRPMVVMGERPGGASQYES